MSKTVKLCDDFEVATVSQWREAASATLKGADFDDTLVRRSEDNLALGPLFSKETNPDTVFLARTQSEKLEGRAWHIDSLINHPDIKTANTEILADLKGGASAITLQVDPIGLHGVAIRNQSDFDRILSGVHTNLIPIALAPHSNIALAALACTALSPDDHISLGLDPFANGAGSVWKWAQNKAPNWHVFSINSRALHEAGASAVQELAGMAAMLSDAAGRFGVPVLNHIDIHLATDADAHMGLVKVRAAKAIIANILEAYGSDAQIPVKVTTSARMLSKMDPWSNMLRLSSAVFGGVTGGANHVTCLPFIHPIGLATPFARRMARGLQLMFMEESHLGHVNDPAHGSYTHETLTHNLAEAAWAQFQALEAAGGWQNESVQNALKQTIISAHNARIERLKNSTAQMIGVNQYTKPDVRKAEVLTRPKVPTRKGEIMASDTFDTMMADAGVGKLIPATSPKPYMDPVRLSEPFETGDA